MRTLSRLAAATSMVALSAAVVAPLTVAAPAANPDSSAQLIELRHWLQCSNSTSWGYRVGCLGWCGMLAPIRPEASDAPAAHSQR